MALIGRTLVERRCTPVLRIIVRVAAVAALLATTAFATACGPGSEEEPAERSVDPAGEGRSVGDSSGAAPAPDKTPAKRKFGDVVAKMHEKHRKAEGREGILAEERLYSNFDEELIIRDFFQDRRDGFYLDVGCAQAVKGSNTFYLEKHLGWRGIGVDAQAEYAPEWKEVRPNSLFVSFLVSDQSDVSEKFFKSYGRGISSTDREWASGKGFGVEWPTEEVQAQTITLDDLLDHEGVTKIDLLSMDIEGHEPKALAGFDIGRFRPELVVIERQVKREKNSLVSAYFERNGYEIIQKYRPFDRVNDYYQPKQR